MWRAGLGVVRADNIGVTAASYTLSPSNVWGKDQAVHFSKDEDTVGIIEA